MGRASVSSVLTRPLRQGSAASPQRREQARRAVCSLKRAAFCPRAPRVLQEIHLHSRVGSSVARVCKVVQRSSVHAVGSYRA